MMTYAFVQLFLHVKKHFPRGTDLFFLWATLRIWALFLSDFQDGGPQFLQLTAGDAQQRSVESVEAQEHDDEYYTPQKL
jgi:hypothetical protein